MDPAPEVGSAVATRDVSTPAPLVAAPVETSIDQLIALALRQSSPVESLERLVALKERVDAKTAAQAFHVAKAEFQRECPQIRKEGTVDYVPTSGGARVKYSYAVLDDIDHTVRPIANRHGLSYSWNSVVEGQSVKVEFILRHTGGHSESSFFQCPTTSKAGMSDQQKFGAAVKYAMRWAMIQGLGLVATDDNRDTDEVDPTPINEDQVVVICDLMEAKRATAKNPDALNAKFLKFMGVEKLADIRATDYQKAVEALTPKKDGAA